jgi:hypothetical protein
MWLLMLKFWREIAIIMLAGTLMFACNDRDHALIAKGRAEQRVHVADSLLNVNWIRLDSSAMRIAYDTTTVLRLATRVMTDTFWRRDTIFMSSDTAHARPMIPVPVNVVATYDTLGPKCTALAHDCGEYKRLAEARFKLYDEKLAVQPTQIKVSCIQPTLFGTIAGAGAGFYLGRRSR